MIIKDECLEPLHIVVESNQYVLKEIRTPDANNPLTKDDTKEYEITHGYFVDLGVLMKKAIVVKLAKDQSTVNLKEFWEQWVFHNKRILELVQSIHQTIEDAKPKILSEEV